MGEKETKELIYNFLKNHEICVLSTVNGGIPQAAVVEFGETPDLEIIFDTFTTSRKYKNLERNPIVAVVIGWDKNITVQYEGKALELEGGELEKCKAIYFAKNPRAKKWENKKNNVYFKIIPVWARYSDLNTDPWEIHEVMF